MTHVTLNTGKKGSRVTKKATQTWISELDLGTYPSDTLRSNYPSSNPEEYATMHAASIAVAMHTLIMIPYNIVMQR